MAPPIFFLLGWPSPPPKKKKLSHCSDDNTRNHNNIVSKQINVGNPIPFNKPHPRHITILLSHQTSMFNTFHNIITKLFTSHSSMQCEHCFITLLTSLQMSNISASLQNLTKLVISVCRRHVRLLLRLTIKKPGLS